MTKTQVTTSGSPRPAGPYSQGIVAGGFLFTAGVGPQDPVTGEKAVGVGDQTRQVLRSLSAVLEAAGATMDDVVKVTAHLQDLKSDFAEFNKAYSEFFTAPYPVRTTVGSTLNDILVEIDFVVKLPD